MVRFGGNRISDFGCLRHLATCEWEGWMAVKKLAFYALLVLALAFLLTVGYMYGDIHCWWQHPCSIHPCDGNGPCGVSL
jgi:hypothetical protein